LIFQQYRKGFRDEFNNTKENDTYTARYRDGVSSPVITATTVVKAIGR